MFYDVKLWVSAALIGLATHAHADPLCAPFSDSAETLDPLTYVDLPDPLAERVSMPIEADLLRSQIQNETPPPLSKIYCDIGMFEMGIRFVQPAEDDAIAATVTQATYAWVPDADPAGWQLTALTRQYQCARGSDPFAPVCP